MFDKKIMAALAAMIFIPAAAMSMGWRAKFPTPHSVFSGSLIFEAEKQRSIVLAQTDTGGSAAKENETPESAPGTLESDAGAEAAEKSADAESKPLAPFVPSEQIAGEQAVDFPADI